MIRHAVLSFVLVFAIGGFFGQRLLLTNGSLWAIVLLTKEFAGN
ncbi:MAG TPA: hypothetical protein VNM72_14635 [Blastocatellia bacterium]|nr:hypothetical protein [Blastocatellia bacterium]